MESEPPLRTHGSAYEIFVLALTVLSLTIMALLILPLAQATLDVLRFYDNLICLVFLGDFVYNLTGSRPKSAYFIDRRGWLDLLGSIPSLGVFPVAALLRLARLSRLVRILRILNRQRRRELIADVLRNRSQYAVFITLFSAVFVLASASVAMTQFESQSPDANIKTGGDALWWAVVTITTVGYGDFYPVTTLGRITAVFVMVTGVGIIGALASILASVLVAAPGADAAEAAGEAASGNPSEPVAVEARTGGDRPAAPTTAPSPSPSPSLMALEDEVRA